MDQANIDLLQQLAELFQDETVIASLKELSQLTERSRNIQLLGAAAFGFIIGWMTYFTNRYRGGQVSFSDLTTLIGIIGGGAVLALFEAKTDLFGAYGIGLFLGFISYFIILLFLVGASKKFSWEWFLDGRRIAPAQDEIAPDMNVGERPMGGGQQPGRPVINPNPGAIGGPGNP